MNIKLSQHQKIYLPRYELELRKFADAANSDAARVEMEKIAGLFGSDRTHHRLLSAKVLYCEGLINANDYGSAEQLLLGIEQVASSSSRVWLEAAALLAICRLRRSDVDGAKPFIHSVFRGYGNIKSDARRRQFQARFVERLEQECILAGIERSDVEMDVDAIHDQAMDLVRKPEDELYEYLAQALPPSSVAMLEDVRGFSEQQIPLGDRLALPAPVEAKRPVGLGAKVCSVVGRLAWRYLCDPESAVYKIWAQRSAKIYEEAYLAAAVVLALKQWGIGATVLASAVVAIAMKYSAPSFCEWAKPKGLMISRSEKE